MKIYFLDSDPYQCAKYHCDKHILMRILETSTILCSAHILPDDLGASGKINYRSEALQNLPITITSRIAFIQTNLHCLWVRESIQNYRWLSELGWALCQEYTIRWDKKHKYEIYLQWLRVNEPNLPDIGLTTFKLLMPAQYESDDPVESYRQYYISDKASIAKWTKREKPYWFIETKLDSIVGDKISGEKQAKFSKKGLAILKENQTKKIKEPSAAYYVKIIDDLNATTLMGKYMELKIEALYLNINLRNSNTEVLRPFTIIGVLYHNLWNDRIKPFASGSTKMIDSDGFQHDGDGLYYFDFDQVALSKDKKYKHMSFTWPELILEGKARTRGWIWFDPLPKGVYPHRFIFKFDIYEPGAISGWVQDSETLEFVIANKDFISHYYE